MSTFAPPAPLPAVTDARPKQSAVPRPVRQLSAAGVAGVWAAAAVPMGLLSWVVAPRLADGLSGPAPLVQALIITLTVGLIWQFALVVGLVYREQRTLRWSVVREVLWLRAPRDPRSGVNGHEWVKRQATKAGIAFTALSNGFAACDQPERLQAICDSFGPEHVQAFFDRWICQIPTPLSAEDHGAGYWWELSMRQVEVSRTLVLDDPRRARSFFEALVAENIGIGRPEQVSMVFARQLSRPTRHPYQTRIFSTGTEVRIDFRYKHSRVKQYLKDGRALRIETIINRPDDLDVKRRLHHLPELIDKARAVNQRLLIIEQAGQSCAIGSALFERIHQPYNREGQRTGALRFGDIRAIALAGALSTVLGSVTGFTNKTLRGLVASLLAQDYSPGKMSYDLRRLRLHGLIQRLPRSNTYTLTDEGIRVAVFYTKLQNRLLRPLLEADKPPAKIEIRRALATLSSAVNEYVENARLAPAH